MAVIPDPQEKIEDRRVDPRTVAEIVNHRRVLGPIDRPSETSVLKLEEERMFPVRFDCQHGWPAETHPGNTRLIAVRGLAQAIGVDSALYLKWEGTNPTGTQKDRVAAAHIKEALAQGFKEVTAATCGNYGEALAYAAREEGVRCTIFVPRNELTNPRRETLKCIERMKNCGAEVKLVGGDYQRAISRSEQYARGGNKGSHKVKTRNVYDANPPSEPGEKFELELNTYAQIAREILQYFERRNEKIAYVVVPIGNGITLLGVERGFEQLRSEGKIDHVPYLVGVSQRNWATWHGETPNLERKIKSGGFDLTKRDLPALAGTALAYKQVRDLLRSGGNLSVDVLPPELDQTLSILREHLDLEMLDESAVTVAAIKRVYPELVQRKTSRLENGAIVLLITGAKD